MDNICTMMIIATRVMRFRNLLAGIACILLAGCSAPSSSVPADTLSTPKAGMAKLIVYYPYSSYWSNWPANVSIGAAGNCRLKSGTFTAYDIKPGENIVYATLCNGSEGVFLKFNSEVGRTYYMQVVPNDHSLLGLIAGSDISMTEGATHAESAAFAIDLMDKEKALQQLKLLALAPR
jgi:hypothetical protein